MDVLNFCESEPHSVLPHALQLPSQRMVDGISAPLRHLGLSRSRPFKLVEGARGKLQFKIGDPLEDPLEDPRSDPLSLRVSMIGCPAMQARL
ncbi:hypothetical protein ACVWXO_006134 [Bradyrhizobium sp. LM2.7]